MLNFEKSHDDFTILTQMMHLLALVSNFLKSNTYVSKLFLELVTS